MALARRILVIVGKTALVLVAAIVVALGVAVVAANFSVSRRFLASQVNRALTTVVAGKITLLDVGHVDFFGVDGVRATLSDPDGRRVVLVSGVRARIDPIGMVRSLAFSKGDLSVDVGSIGVDDADVSLDENAKGELRLLAAVAPREKTVEKKPSAGPSLTLRFDELKLRHAWVHGMPLESLVVDADLRDVAGALRVLPNQTTIEIHHARIVARAMPRAANPRGNATATLSLPSGDAPPEIAASFDGDVGDAPVTVRGSLHGGKLDARVDAQADAPTLQRLLPELQFQKRAKVHVEAGGLLPRVTVRGTVTCENATVEIDGTANLGSTTSGDVHVDAEHVDLADLLSTAPRSDITALVDASGSVRPGDVPRGTFQVRTPTATIDGQKIPPVTAEGKMAGGQASASVSVAEPGLPVRADVTFRAHEGRATLDAVVTATVSDLLRVPRLRGNVKGSAQVRAKVALELPAQTVHGDLTVHGDHVGHGAFEATKVDLTGEIDGRVDDPVLSATLNATDVRYGTRTFPAVSASARGRLEHLVVSSKIDGTPRTPAVSAAANVALNGGVRLTNASATFERAHVKVTADVGKVTLGDGLRLDGVVVTGAGEPMTADLHLFPAGLDVRAASKGLELGPIARVLGVTGPPMRGRLACDVDVSERGSEAHGHVGIDVSDVSLSGISNGEAHVNLTLKDRDLDGTVSAKSDEGHAQIQASKVHLAGPLLEPRSFESATGAVELDADVDLKRLKEALPEHALSCDELGGTLVATGKYVRPSLGAPPEVTLSAHTESLRIAANSPEEGKVVATGVRVQPGWTITGVDTDVELSVEPTRGTTNARVHLQDQHGLIADFDASATVPYGALARGAADVDAALYDVPIEAHLTMPRRRLSEYLPGSWTDGLDAVVSASVEAKQTLRHPRVEIDADVADLGLRGRASSLPFSTHLAGHYGDDAGALDVNMSVKQSAALSLQSEWRGDLLNVVLHPDSPAPWDASVRAHLAQFPLDVVPQLASLKIVGKLSGDLDASGGTRSPPKVHAAFATEGLSVARVAGNSATIDFDADTKTASAQVKITESDGSAEGSAKVGIDWSKLLAPTIDPGGTTHAEAKATHFRIVVLRPFLRDIVRSLDGRVDADGTLDVANRAGRPTIKGYLNLAQGQFQLVTFGQEFHDVETKVQFDPDGVVRAKEIAAKGVTGAVSGSGEVHFDGLRFQRAKVSLKVDKKDALPVTIEGQSLAQAWGTFDMDAAPAKAPHAIDVTIDVPSAGVKLPEQSTHELQDLATDPHVRVGYYENPDDFVVIPLEKSADSSSSNPLTLVIEVKLHDLEVDRGSDLRARIDGSPTITTGGSTQVTGQINLRSGYLEVQGKRFEIERGTITFTGAPDNPEVIVTAGWNAPEGTRVYADFVGPLKTGKVTLRSDPSHTNSEILSLILFGTTDGSNAPSSSSGAPGTSGAVGLGGGLVGQGLSKALDDLTGLDITTRIDTSDS
ncbi:MAG TPA: translocation/assembly module TamB domain-containing protein, partial [Polyangiaceae bacterium]|nr:translocation/assembly module TamB domain-containing protein [Polyangiaceae bacterium]